MANTNASTSQEVLEKIKQIPASEPQKINELVQELEQHRFFVDMDLETIEVQMDVRKKIDKLLGNYKIISAEEYDLQSRLQMLHDWLEIAIEKKEKRPKPAEPEAKEAEETAVTEREPMAEEGEVVSSPKKNAIKLKLKNGSADETLPQDPDNFYKLVFETYYMTLNFKKAMDFKKIERKPREMSIAELRKQIKSFDRKNISTTPLYIEIHNKLALAFSNLVFVLLGIPIAIRTHRREKSINFGLTMILFLVYWGIMLGGVACTIRNITPPWFGIWLANILLFSVGLFLFIKLTRK